MVQILLDFKYVSTSNNWAIEWVDLNWRFFSLPCVSPGMQYALSFPIIRAPALGLLSLKMHLYKFFYVLFALHFFLLKMNADWKLKLIYEFIQKFLLYLPPSTYLNCNWFSMVCSSLYIGWKRTFAPIIGFFMLKSFKIEWETFCQIFCW